MIKIISYIFLILLLTACSVEKKELTLALDAAKENRSELETVLKHYSLQAKDSLKLRAAQFLIENMPYHFYYDGEKVEQQLNVYKIIAESKERPQVVIDSIYATNPPPSLSNHDKKSDIKEISSKLLIDNIEWAFKIWEEQPWGKNICFDDFCEFILPYRIGDEKPTFWREDIYTKYNHYLDSFRKTSQADDPMFAARAILDTLSNLIGDFTFTGLIDSPHVGPKVIEYKSGSCREFTDFAVYAMRSLGIPCGIEVIVRGDANANHFWCFILDKNKKTYMTVFPWKRPLRKSSEYWMSRGKVYRQTFSLNKKMQNDIRQLSSDIYPTFQYPRIRDVTAEYADNLTLSIPLKRMYPLEHTPKIIYLCLSSYRNWIPIAWTDYHKDKLVFSNIEGDAVFRLAIWENEQLIMCSDPFSVDRSSGQTYFFNAQEKMDTMTVFHKFPLSYSYCDRMLGGVVEGSNSNDFKHPDTLLLIKEIPYRLNNYAKVTNEKKYRYIRYKGAPNNSSDIAELALFKYYKDSISLKGKIIGENGSNIKDDPYKYTRTFDGDPYTSFGFEDDTIKGWAGIDFGYPQAIKKILYIPRNSDDFIRKEDVYEFSYWGDKQWISAGISIAKSDSLIYIVPHGTLYYIDNKTRGKDKRIFEYKDGKQKYW